MTNQHQVNSELLYDICMTLGEMREKPDGECTTLGTVKALVSCWNNRHELKRENARLREDRDKLSAWVDEIFRNLGLPAGDMGALEDYILANASRQGRLEGDHE